MIWLQKTKELLFPHDHTKMRILLLDVSNSKIRTLPTSLRAGGTLYVRTGPAGMIRTVIPAMTDVMQILPNTLALHFLYTKARHCSSIGIFCTSTVFKSVTGLHFTNDLNFKKNI